MFQMLTQALGFSSEQNPCPLEKEADDKQTDM